MYYTDIVQCKAPSTVCQGHVWKQSRKNRSLTLHTFAYISKLFTVFASKVIFHSPLCSSKLVRLYFYCES